MSTLTTASHQWYSRPSDERFTSLTEMSQHFHNIRNASRSVVASTKSLHVKPTEDNNLLLEGKAEVGYEPTNWSFGQLCNLAEAPAAYLRTLPAPMSADCINYGLQFKRDIEDVGLLLHKNGGNTLRAATGPRYGRVWNSDLTDALIDRFGDGISGQWRVPGEFGKALDQVTKANTTLYASDRDCFIFLADEERRIEFNGRNLARGFFTWNSETGSKTFGIAGFLFDYVCKNRMIWGAAEYKELKFRHTASAPDRFLHDVAPALQKYSESETLSITDALDRARKDKLADVGEFLSTRYGPKAAYVMQQIHQFEEHRPVETRWDCVVAGTAYAKSIEHQDRRVEFEREVSSLLNA